MPDERMPDKWIASWMEFEIDVERMDGRLAEYVNGLPDERFIR